MFTGIVEGVGTLVRLEAGPELVEIEVDVGAQLACGVAVGASVALDGCCLTVTRVAGGVLSFQAVPETRRRTSLARRRVGDPVNVERALRADGRLDGHLVQGHVDGTGVVEELQRAGRDVRLWVRCDRELAGLLVPKGSVAVDGVSLTVVEAEGEAFSVALIPHTLEATTLGRRRPGDLVNLEADVIGKYVLRYLGLRFRGDP